MDNLDAPDWLILSGIAAVVALGWYAIDDLPIGDAVAEWAREKLLQAGGLAVLALLVLAALAAPIPIWVRALLALAVFIAAGGYDILAVAFGLPALPGPGPGGMGAEPGTEDTETEGAGDLPDPCIVGPYRDDAGILHACLEF